jgi:PAS domain-containing protein
MLILWLAASAAQERQWPYLFLMKSDTALCLLILAIGLFGIWAKGRAFNFVGAACACLVIAFAAAALTQYSLSIDLRIDQWRAIYGLLPTDAFPYSNFLAAIVPDQRERVQSSAEQALRASTDYKEQYEVRWPDGSVPWVLAYGRPLIDERGITARMVG